MHLSAYGHFSMDYRQRVCPHGIETDGLPESWPAYPSLYSPVRQYAAMNHVLWYSLRWLSLVAAESIFPITFSFWHLHLSDCLPRLFRIPSWPSGDFRCKGSQTCSLTNTASYFHRKSAAAFRFHAENGIPRIFTGNCPSLEHLMFAFLPQHRKSKRDGDTTCR